MCHYPNLYDLLHLAPIYDDRRPAFECCHLEKALTHFPFDTVERHIIQTSLFLGLWWNVKQDNYEILFFYYYYFFILLCRNVNFCQAQWHQYYFKQILFSSFHLVSLIFASETPEVQSLQPLGLNRLFLESQRNSRCVCCLLSVIYMWRCVGSRAAEDMYYPEGAKGELDCFIALCHHIWSDGLGSAPCKEGTETRWLKTDSLHSGLVISKVGLVFPFSWIQVSCLFLAPVDVQLCVNLVFLNLGVNMFPWMCSHLWLGQQKGVSLRDYNRISI